MGQCLLYRSGIVTFNLIHSSLSSGFVLSVFIYCQCCKHKIYNKIINNALNSLSAIWASQTSDFTSGHVSFIRPQTLILILGYTCKWSDPFFSFCLLFNIQPPRPNAFKNSTGSYTQRSKVNKSFSL